jgi:PrtD family type I secretion system ABC transporter
MKPLWQTAGGIIAPLGWICLFSFFLNLLYLAAPLYMTQIYDRVMRSQSIPTLLYLTLAVGMSFATLAILDAVRGQILAGISDIIEQRLGSALLHQATAPLRPGAPRPAASLLGRDLDIVRQYAAGPAILAWVDLPWAPLNLLAISLLHWKLGVFAFFSALLLVSLSLLAERAARGPMAQANSVAGRAYQFGDVLSRFADCASTMGLGQTLSARWRGLRLAMLSAQSEASRRAVLLGATARFARLFLQSAILGFGAYLAIQHDITGGAMFAASLLLGRTLAPIEAVIAAWRGTLAAKDAFGRLSRAAAHDEDARPALSLPDAAGELSLTNVVWTPEGAERPALRGITLKIEPGAVLAIIGPSAAGKSSLARVLAGALRPDSGIVRLDGAEYDSWNPEQIGRAIGYLPQEVALFPGTIAENIARFTSFTDQQIVAASQAARAHTMIAGLQAGYATMIDDTQGRLSGGQRQRVALARALFGDPPVLILDEPNANLDAEGEAALIACVIEARQRHRTVIMITHNIALVRIADSVATMVGGHVMKVQATSEFLGRPASVKATA